MRNNNRAYVLDRYPRGSSVGSTLQHTSASQPTPERLPFGGPVDSVTVISKVVNPQFQQLNQKLDEINEEIKKIKITVPTPPKLDMGRLNNISPRTVLDSVQDGYNNYSVTTPQRVTPLLSANIQSSMVIPSGQSEGSTTKSINTKTTRLSPLRINNNNNNNNTEDTPGAHYSPTGRKKIAVIDFDDASATPTTTTPAMTSNNNISGGDLSRNGTTISNPRGSISFAGLKNSNGESTSEVDTSHPSRIGSAGGAVESTFGGRKKGEAARLKREKFFQPFKKINDLMKENGLDERDWRAKSKIIDQLIRGASPCTWLTTIALAVGYVSGVPVTVEHILKTTRVGVHYISFPSICMAELFDFTNDYIDAVFQRDDKRRSKQEREELKELMKNLTPAQLENFRHVHCEVALLDSEVLDEDITEMGSGGSNGAWGGERGPVRTLAQFRKELSNNIADENSIYMIQYDPRVIEQHELRIRANNAETEGQAAEILASGLWPDPNQGTFAIIKNFNAALATVTILTPHLDTRYKVGEEESKRRDRKLYSFFRYVVLEEHTVTIQNLYQAMCVKDNYCKRSRGFVRVYIRRNYIPATPSIFPLFVLDGSSAGGLLTSTLDVSIAPHVLGLSMLHHLVVSFLLSESSRRKQSSKNLLKKADVCDVKLRGIPVTKICQQLRLPISAIVGNSTKASVPAAYCWYHVFLQQLQIDKEVHLGLVLPARRGGADDAPSNISEEAFLSHLRLVMYTKSVMLIGFNINIALNVNVEPGRSEPCHFAIFIGLDDERGMIRLADVNVKKNHKTWHVPFMRLYAAVLGYGYIVATRKKEMISQLDCQEFQDRVLREARYFLPPQTEERSRFEYPLQNYAVTVAADAIDRMGYRADAERLLNYSGFHTSFLLSDRIPIEGLGIIIQNFSHYALDDALSIKITHFDSIHRTQEDEESSLLFGSEELGVRSPAATRFYTSDDLRGQIQHALESPSTRRLLINFDLSIIRKAAQVWNGSNGGSYALIVGFNSETDEVIVSDANCNPFHRTWSCPLFLLFRAISTMDLVCLRARGTLLITNEESQEDLFLDTKGYDIAHAQVHHPFKRSFSPVASCIALAATELMQGFGNRQLLSNEKKKTDEVISEEMERLKYRRYNNIFSAEDLLFAHPDFSVCFFLTGGDANASDSVIHTTNEAFTRLRLPLEMICIARRAHEPRSATPPQQYNNNNNNNNNTIKNNNNNNISVNNNSSSEGNDSMAPWNEAAFDSDEAFIQACAGVPGLLTVTMITYQCDKVHKGYPHDGRVSAGLLNRVDEEGKMLQVVEGNPCVFGAFWTSSVEAVRMATTTILRIQEKEGSSDEDELDL